MNFRDGDPGKIITLLGQLTTPADPSKLYDVVVSDKKLAAFVDDLTADRAQLVSAAPVVDGPGKAAVLQTKARNKGIDRRADAGIRATHLTSLAAIQLAVAEGRDDDADRLQEAHRQVYAGGLSHLTHGPASQTGSSTRLIGRASSATALSGISLCGKDWQALLGVASSTNAELAGTLPKPGGETPVPTGTGEFTAMIVASGTLSLFEDAARHALNRTADASRRAGIEMLLEALGTAAASRPPTPRAADPAPATPPAAAATAETTKTDA